MADRHTTKSGKSQALEYKIFHQLEKAVADYNPHYNKDRLKQAFELAAKTHASHFRDSGEPYIVHPLSTALILTEYHADEDTLVAAILHDAVEDSSDISLAQITSQFGVNVAKLVDGVTKISASVAKSEQKELIAEFFKVVDIETIRKMFEKSKDDIRIILIKLADRLHNMQTIAGKSDFKKRKLKAHETFTVFVQIAARLGIWKMKRDLENLSFPFLFPEESQHIRSFLDKSIKKRDRILKKIHTVLKRRDLKKHILGFEPYNRGMFTLKCAFDEKKQLTVNDNLLVRLYVRNEDSAYLALGLIHKIWKRRGREDDYISNPRDNGYQAYHTEVVTEEGDRVEFMIMTEEMHERNWYGIAYDCYQKKKGVIPNFLLPFEVINEKTVGRAADFLEATTKDLLEQKIEIHTKGQSVHMPLTSTVLDFVFYAFPQKALFSHKIYVNDKDVPFGFLLTDGDVVRAEFSKESTIDYNWFYNIKTTTARIAVQEALQKWGYERKIRVGYSILQRQFDLYEKGNSNQYMEKHWSKLKIQLSISTLNEFYVLIAEGNIKPYEAFVMCFPKVKPSFFMKILNWFDSLFEHMFFRLSRGEELFRLKIEGILDSDRNLINVISSIRKSEGLSIANSYLQENKQTNTFVVKMCCRAPDRKSYYNFLTELEQQKGIINVSPQLSYRKQRFFAFWVIITLLTWGALPFLLSIGTPYISSSFPFARTIVVYLTFIPIVIVNYILYSFIRNYFVQIRNSARLVAIGSLLNLGGIGIYISLLIGYGFHFDIYIVLSIFFLLNFLILYQYLTAQLVYRSSSNEDKQLRHAARHRIKNRLLGYGFGILSACIWGINPIMIRHLVLDNQIVYFTVVMRLFLGGVFLFLFLGLLRLFGLKKESKKKMRYTPTFWLMTIGLSGNFLLFHYGLKFTTATNANLIENFAPIIILIVIGILLPKLSHQIGRNKSDIFITFLIICIGSIGASLVLHYFPKEMLPDYDTKLFGDFIEILAMLFFALFIMSSNLFMKKQDASSLEITSRVLLAAAIIISPFMLLEPVPILSGEQWFWLCTIGIVSTGIAYSLWNKAAKNLSVIPASLLLNFTVVVTILVENQLYGLPIGMTMIVGAALIIIASISAELMNMKYEKIIKLGR